MADNTTLNAGTGGDVAASDDIGGVKFQRIKLIHGADGVNAGDVSTANGLPVSQIGNSLVSTSNSSAANLLASAVFTGAWEDVSEYSNISATVFSSHASATDGLSMQQSSDGVNADLIDAYSIPAATGKIFQLGVAAKFYRLVYTNGATLTTSLRIQSLYSKATKKGSSVRSQDARTNDNDFEEVLAYLAGFNGTTWDRLRSTIANGLAVDVTRLPALAAGANSIGTTPGPALTKGTQGTVGHSTQDLKDAGRVIFSCASAIAGVTAVTAEALVTMIPQRDGTAGASVTSHFVTSGKRLRLIGMNVGLISTGASVLSGRFSLRMGTVTVSATSPIITTAAIPSGAALAQAGGMFFIPFPDGIEFSGTMQFGVSQVCSAATGTIWCSLVGFEY